MVGSTLSEQEFAAEYIHKLISMRFSGGDVCEEIERRHGSVGDLARIYASQRGAGVHKWLHYFPIYEQYFGRFRNKSVRMLEIGVDKGGSLDMWRTYLGDAACLYGIDINPSCARFDGKSGQVRIGSQTDAAFLESVVAEMGGVDIVLDDGSHVMGHSRASLRTLFPLLSEGGVYMVEDLHTAYWPHYRGGVRAPGNFFNDVRSFIDEMHRPYSSQIEALPEFGGMLAGIHIHDSIVVLDKKRVPCPAHCGVS